MVVEVELGGGRAISFGGGSLVVGRLRAEA